MCSTARMRVGPLQPFFPTTSTILGVGTDAKKLSGKRAESSKALSGPVADIYWNLWGAPE